MSVGPTRGDTWEEHGKNLEEVWRWGLVSGYLAKAPESPSSIPIYHLLMKCGGNTNTVCRGNIKIGNLQRYSVDRVRLDKGRLCRECLRHKRALVESAQGWGVYRR